MVHLNVSKTTFESKNVLTQKPLPCKHDQITFDSHLPNMDFTKSSENYIIYITVGKRILAFLNSKLLSYGLCFQWNMILTTLYFPPNHRSIWRSFKHFRYDLNTSKLYCNTIAHSVPGLRLRSIFGLILELLRFFELLIL